jgi:hypothetical protein
MTKEQTAFIAYVLSFYGKGQMYSNFFKKPVTKVRVTKAVKQLLAIDREFCADSYDRELVRDIMLQAEGVTNTEHKLAI